MEFVFHAIILQLLQHGDCMLIVTFYWRLYRFFFFFISSEILLAEGNWRLHTPSIYLPDKCFLSLPLCFIGNQFLKNQEYYCLVLSILSHCSESEVLEKHILSNIIIVVYKHAMLKVCN